MNKHAKFALLCALPLIAGFGLAGCSSHDSSTATGSTHHESPTSSSNAASASDIAFAQMMIPHHEQAVEMATLAPTRASSAFIKELADQIQTAQQPEIDQMAGWLNTWGVPRMNMTDSMNAHGGHGMAGIVSDAEMTALAQAQGKDFDRRFAELMIGHHEGAIEMATAVQSSSDAEVASLASKIIAAQQIEIQQLRSFLEQ